jgi:hypothetical protein
MYVHFEQAWGDELSPSVEYLPSVSFGDFRRYSRHSAPGNGHVTHGGKPLRGVDDMAALNEQVVRRRFPLLRRQQVLPGGYKTADCGADDRMPQEVPSRMSHHDHSFRWSLPLGAILKLPD